jgi:hypothetical protein
MPVHAEFNVVEHIKRFRSNYKLLYSNYILSYQVACA